jgi:hypothetical protein
MNWGLTLSSIFAWEARLPPEAQQEIARAQRHLVRLEYCTIAWILVEALGGVGAGVAAHVLALISFGANALLELLSALVIIRLIRRSLCLERTTQAELDRTYSRVSAVLLGAFGVGVAATATWSLLQPRPGSFSGFGLVLTIASIPIMYAIARAKVSLNKTLGSGAIHADAVMSSSCAAIALVAAVCVSSHLARNLCWVDAVGSFAIAVIVIREALLVWSGQGCGCAMATARHAHDFL